MKKVMLYPFDKCSIPLVKYTDLSDEIQIEKLVSLKGWSGSQTYTSGGKKLAVTEDFESALSAVDMVCIVENWIDISFDKYLLPRVEEALEQGKTVFVTKPICPEERVALESIPLASEKLLFPENPRPFFSKFLEINTPIIAVGGYGRGMEKLEAELSLTKVFKGMGYNPLLIASNPAASLVGGKTIPAFMFEGELSGDEKIRAFNYFVGELESKENPDIIVLGLPGAVVANDPINFADFGVIAFEISQAVPIDQILAMSPYWEYPKTYFDRLEELILGRLGAPVPAHALSKNTYDFSTLHEATTKTTLTVDEETVGRITKEMDIPKLVNIYDESEVRKLCETVVSEYGAYAEVGRYT